MRSAESPPLRLRDVATLKDAAAPKFGDTLIMGKPGVMLGLSSQYGANTLEGESSGQAPEDQNPYVALTLNVRVSRRILASCADLIQRGVDIRGVYVKRVAETGDERLAPKLETVAKL